MNTGNNGPATDARRLADAARDAARRARAAGNTEVEALIADVEELIARLGEPADPGVAQLCTRVANALADARRALGSRAVQAQRQAREALAAGDSYVHAQPWPAIGLAMAAGLVCGLLIFRR
jgi:ElaB/YqjD/DUF883 family membrane-anchored ribosome-binding protein